MLGLAPLHRQKKCKDVRYAVWFLVSMLLLGPTLPLLGLTYVLKKML